MCHVVSIHPRTPHTSIQLLIVPSIFDEHHHHTRIYQQCLFHFLTFHCFLFTLFAFSILLIFMQSCQLQFITTPDLHRDNYINHEYLPFNKALIHTIYPPIPVPHHLHRSTIHAQCQHCDDTSPSIRHTSTSPSTPFNNRCRCRHYNNHPTITTTNIAHCAAVPVKVNQLK